MSLHKRAHVSRKIVLDSSDEDEMVTRAVKSRVAAKSRRDKECVEMANLTEALPFSLAALEKLDKNTIIRLAIAYIHMKTYLQKEMKSTQLAPEAQKCLEGPEPMDNSNNSHDNSLSLPTQSPPVAEGSLMLEGLQGFLIFINKKGKVMYVSDNIELHLGILQVTLLGKSILDVIHPEDTKELGKQFAIRVQKGDPSDPICVDDPVSASSRNLLNSDQKRVFYVRMKYYLQKNGSKTRTTGYTLVQWTGRLKLKASSKALGYKIDGLICICRPVQTNSLLEIRMDGNMFMSRHDLGMRFTFCDPRILSLVGYEPNELIGKTAYYFHNPLDAPKISDCHSNLILKGTSVSKYYRFFGKNGDWVWLQTRATIIYNTSNEPQYVVCMNYVIGEDEGQRYLMMEEEEKGYRDPNVRGSIYLTTNTESPMSTCSSGDEGHDDTGYSSSYTANSDASPGGLTTAHPSPDIHSMESGDEQGDMVQDYPMTDVSEQTDLPKESTEPTNEVSVAMTNGFDPFLSSFREEMAMADSAVDDDIDLLEDLLSSMEQCEKPDPKDPVVPPAAPDPPPPLPVPVPVQPSTDTGKKQSLLRTLLNKGDSAMPQNSMELSLTSDSSSPVLKDAILGSASNLILQNSREASTSVSNPSLEHHTYFTQPQKMPQQPTSTSMGTGPMMSLQIDSLNPTDVPAPPATSQPDPFIPDDLLDFAMQYCDSIANEQAQAIMMNYGQDLWTNSVDDLITTLADAQPTESDPVTSTTGTLTQQEPVSYLDLDTVNCRSQPISANPKQTVTKDFNQINTLKDLSAPALGNANRGTFPPQSVLCPSQTSLGMFGSQIKITSRPSTSSNTSTSSLLNGPFSSRCAVGADSAKSQASTSRSNGKHRTPYATVSSRSDSRCSSPRLRSPGLVVSVGVTADGVVKSVRHASESVRSLVHSGMSRSNGRPGVCGRGQALPANMSRSGAQISATKSRVHASTASRPTGMSELEKYLRGYVDPEKSFQQGKAVKSNVSKNTGSTPFLQKLLTGELSHELYRKIDSQMVRQEKERRSSTLPDVKG